MFSRQIFLGCVFLLFACLNSCKAQYLTGYYSKTDFLKACKWDEKVDEHYKPNATYLHDLESTAPFDVKLFLGTWCGDSKHWVPKFFKIDSLLPIHSLEIIAVDTTKRDSLHVMQQYHVTALPTFIFIRNGQELGRIVEEPKKKKLEKNMYQIVK